MRRQPVDLVGQEAQVASGCLGGRRGAQPQKSGATTHVFADQREIARQTGLVPKPPRCPQAQHPGCDLGSGSTGHEPGDDSGRAFADVLATGVVMVGSACARRPTCG